MFKRILAIALLVIFFSGCGGGGGGGNGDSTYEPPPPPPPSNTTSITVDLNTLEVVGGSTASGGANADFVLNNDDNSFTGSVQVTGLTADNVALSLGYAGETGAEIIALSETTPGSWSLPANTVLTQTQVDDLTNGGVYVQVTTTALPEGALRAQIVLAGVTVLRVELSALQSVPLKTSTASGLGFITYNGNGDLVAHVNTTGVDDAVMAHIHNAVAGRNGLVLIGLSQDAADPAHWFVTGANLDAAGLAALNAAELYINIHTPANPGGEIRGQIVPPTREVSFTEMTGDEVVVAGSTGVTTTASAVAALTLDPAAHTAIGHINTSGLTDATSATLNQAPMGQNGPVIVDFTQDNTDLSHWSADSIVFSDAQFTALRNRGLYFTIATPAEPAGEVRGQLIPKTSMSPPTTASFQVSTVDPADAASLAAFPNQIIFTFNRAVLAGSAMSNAFTLTASGGDGSFGEANDVAITGFGVNAGTNTITLDLSGIAASDDVYRVQILDNVITDSAGIILDGDSDGTAGGVFSSNFSVTTPPPSSNANLTFIQANVFTPICSGCHGGPTPSAGMNLTAGQAFANIVNVNSSEVPSLLRIKPGDPDNSYLIRKIEGTATVGGRMPLGGAPLSPTLIQTIRDWISDGALNN